MLGRMGVDLLIDPVNLGWYRSLRVVLSDSPIVNTLDNLPFTRGTATATGNLGLEIITANRTKLGRNNFSSFGGEDIHMELSTDAIKILENNLFLIHLFF